MHPSSRPLLMLSTALVSARADFFPPSLANLRGGASNDLVDSLTSLKELLNKLETRVKTPPPTVEPLVVDPQVGDLVRVRPDVEQPKFDWGEATHTSVGRLTWYFEDRCTVDFPKHPGWNGLLSELERVSADEEEEEEEEAGDEAPALALAVGMQVRLRPGAAPPDGGWGAAGPPAEDSANLTSWVGEVEALGADGEEVTVVLEHGARWTGVASSLDVLEDPDAPRDRSDVDPTARLRRLGERSRRRGSAAGGTPRAPLFSRHHYTSCPHCLRWSMPWWPCARATSHSPSLATRLESTSRRSSRACLTCPPRWPSCASGGAPWRILHRSDR